MSKAIVEAMRPAARDRRRTVLRLRPTVAVLIACVLLGGCTTGPAPAPDPPGDSPRAEPLRLDASVAQFRFDEGTRNLKAGIVNEGRTPVRISAGTIDWDGFAFPTISIPDADIPPGQAAAFTIAYGAPRCDREPAAEPTMVAVVDGQTRRLPLRVEDPGLLLRLHDKACARRRLDAVATVRLQLSKRTETVAGEEYVPARVVLRHRPGATARVRLTELGGSVLFDLVPRAGQGALPVDLSAGATRVVVPVLAGSAGRCDDHARSQSSQTFLWSLYVRLDGGAQQRIVTIPDEAEQTRLLALLDRACR